MLHDSSAETYEKGLKIPASLADKIIVLGNSARMRQRIKDGQFVNRLDDLTDILDRAGVSLKQLPHINEPVHLRMPVDGEWLNVLAAAVRVRDASTRRPIEVVRLTYGLPAMPMEGNCWTLKVNDTFIDEPGGRIATIERDISGYRISDEEIDWDTNADSPPRIDSSAGEVTMISGAWYEARLQTDGVELGRPPEVLEAAITDAFGLFASQAEPVNSYSRRLVA